MHLNLYRKSGKIKTFIVPSVVAYNRTLALIDSPYSNYFRVTLTDPLAGDRILRDSYIDQKEKVA
jgi:hypothetical protein